MIKQPPILSAFELHKYSEAEHNIIDTDEESDAGEGEVEVDNDNGVVANEIQGGVVADDAQEKKSVKVKKVEKVEAPSPDEPPIWITMGRLH